MRSEPPVQDLTALDTCVRDAAANTPECGGARRELAGVAPGRHSRPLTRPQASTKRRGTLAHVTVGSRGAIVPRRRSAPEGGGVAAPASWWRRQNAQDEGITSGVISHRSKERQVNSKVKEMRRRWSLATAAGRAVLRCDRGRGSYGPGDENLQQPELDEPLVNPRRKKEGR
jgi:hypothetical protein